MGDEEKYVEEVTHRLAKNGYSVSTVQLRCGNATVGYQSHFRLKWFATRLHFFVVLVSADHADAADLDGAIAESILYAKSRKGRWRGWQTAIAVAPIVVSRQVQAEARLAAESKPTKRWLVICLPVAIDLATHKRYMYRGPATWGRAYTSWLREQLDTLLMISTPPVE